MPEIQFDPYVLHQFSAEPVYVEGSRVDSVLVQDTGTPGPERYLVFRDSLQTYEATVELTGLNPNAPILCDAVYIANLFEWTPHAHDRLFTSFYLDDRLAAFGTGSVVETSTSGEVPVPPYTTAYDGSTQAFASYALHPALPSEDPDEQYLNQEFPFTDGPYFVRDSIPHINHPYYFYIYPPLPETFTVQVVAGIALPGELRADIPTDVGPFELVSPGHYEYPAGDDEYGTPSSQADTTYAQVERVEWPTHRLDVFQFGNLIPPGEVFASEGPRGVIRSRRVPGKRAVAESLAASASGVVVGEVGDTPTGIDGEVGVVDAAADHGGNVSRPLPT